MDLLKRPTFEVSSDSTSSDNDEKLKPQLLATSLKTFDEKGDMKRY